MIAVGAGSLTPLLASADARTPICLSISTEGTCENDFSDNPCIGVNGRFVVFTSCASNLVVGDTNDEMDAFVRGPLFTLPPSPYTFSEVASALRFAGGLKSASAEGLARCDVNGDG